ncbi:aliphatic sulfonate ABC transporter substrate-binding protein [Niallia sp. 03091]|uniref:aliphatic sulfonate ABC transporter substrate-binding protein n=1 Tax=unclassified Niallia TaxID=2837522 RepID=UPI0040443CA8
MKKTTIIFTVFLLLLLTGCGAKQSAGSKEKLKVINIAIQQSLTPLLLAKEKGWFEEEFKKDGIQVKWTEFQSGPPQFEGVSAGKIDFAGVGNSPVIAAQAAGIGFKELSVYQDGLKGNAILVNKDSDIKSIQDLKGKKVAVAKGSSGFDFLYKAIDKAGLKPDDVQVIQLQPDEAKPAFDSGSVDAWSIWEPFISIETINNGAKVLANGEALDNLYSPAFLLVRSDFSDQHPKETVRFLQVIQKAVTYQKEHREEVVDIYAKAKKLDKKIVESVLNNTEATNNPVTDEIIQAQQETADFQYRIGAIRKKIDVKEVVDNSFIEEALKSSKEEGGK